MLIFKKNNSEINRKIKEVSRDLGVSEHIIKGKLLNKVRKRKGLIGSFILKLKGWLR